MKKSLLGSLLILVLSLGSVSLVPADEVLDKKVRDSNNALLQLFDRLEKTGDAGSRYDLGELVKRRQTLLLKLVQLNAEKALRLSFSPDLLMRIRAVAPELSSSLESYGTWTGTLECIAVDDATMTKGWMVHNFNTGRERVEIHFAGKEPDTRSGDVYKVKGVRVGKDIAVSNYRKQQAATNAPAEVASATCSSTGDQKTIVLLVTFPGIIAPDVTTQAVSDIFFATSGHSVSEYWKEASYNKTSASGDVKGWYTLDKLYSCDDYTGIRAAAISAADADVDFRNYTRLFIIYPSPGGCTYGGYGYYGCSTLSSADGSFSASTAVMLASYVSSRDSGVQLAVHEGGHNLTLKHARSRDFGSEALGAIGTQGTLSEYGDANSAMGQMNFHHYAAPHKVLLGWLSTNDYQTVTSGGDYTILPTESSSPGLKALKVQRGTSSGYLWVEYRQPIGNYDTTLSSQIFSGALIHYQDSYTGSYSDLLDYTTSTSSFSDAALAVGQTWTDPYSGLTISAESATSSGLTVGINFGTGTCTHVNPTVTLSPANPSVYPGNSANYTVTVQNNDSSQCSAGTFTMSTTVPSGWNSAWSSSSVTLNPGQSSSVTMTKTAPSTAGLGTYSVNGIATNGGYSATGPANVTVTSPPPPLTVTLSAPDGPYTQGQIVPIRATVYSGSSPASGASLTFTMTKAGGAKTTKTATADATGIAAWNYRVKAKDPKGTYSVVATATLGSQSGTSSSDTFIVQ